MVMADCTTQCFSKGSLLGRQSRNCNISLQFFETFSYLPPLTGDQIAMQVDYIVLNGLYVLEFRTALSSPESTLTSCMCVLHPYGNSPWRLLMFQILSVQCCCPPYSSLVRMGRIFKSLCQIRFPFLKPLSFFFPSGRMDTMLGVC